MNKREVNLKATEKKSTFSFSLYYAQVLEHTRDTGLRMQLKILSHESSQHCTELWMKCHLWALKVWKVSTLTLLTIQEQPKNTRQFVWHKQYLVLQLKFGYHFHIIENDFVFNGQTNNIFTRAVTVLDFLLPRWSSNKYRGFAVNRTTPPP